MIEVALLGTSGMMPLPTRFTSSVLMRVRGKLILLDCGEGIQISMKMLGWGFVNLDYICITHFHGDHILGITGLLLTIKNSGRTEPITIIGPVGIERVVNSLLVVATELTFDLKFIELEYIEGHEINLNLKIDLNTNLIFSALGATHTMECFSYKFELPRKGKFDVLRAKELDIPVSFWGQLQNGMEITYNNKIYTEDMVLGEVRKSIIVTYITDTRPPMNIEEFAKNSDLLVCEGMYGDHEKIEKAIERGHMIFKEAANIAKSAEVIEMWLTHFSPSMSKPEEFLENATEIFENTIIGEDRMNKKLVFQD